MNLRRSSIGLHVLHGIRALSPNANCVNHVSGIKCQPCLGKHTARRDAELSDFDLCPLLLAWGLRGDACGTEPREEIRGHLAPLEDKRLPVLASPTPASIVACGRRDVRVSELLRHVAELDTGSLIFFAVCLPWVTPRRWRARLPVQ
jgi:hypothetical protein